MTEKLMVSMWSARNSASGLYKAPGERVGTEDFVQQLLDEGWEIRACGLDGSAIYMHPNSPYSGFGVRTE